MHDKKLTTLSSINRACVCMCVCVCVCVSRSCAFDATQFEGQTHRELLRSDIFMRELVAELLWVTSRTRAAQPRLREVIWEEMIDSASARRKERSPVRDDQCYWDYWDMRCTPSKYCVYRYKFGDLRLSQSCRLRPRDDDDDDPNSATKDAGCPMSDDDDEGGGDGDVQMSADQASADGGGGRLDAQRVLYAVEEGIEENHEEEEEEDDEHGQL